MNEDLEAQKYLDAKGVMEQFHKTFNNTVEHFQQLSDGTICFLSNTAPNGLSLIKTFNEITQLTYIHICDANVL